MFKKEEGAGGGGEDASFEPIIGKKEEGEAAYAVSTEGKRMVVTV